MKKETFSPRVNAYPMPVSIVGATVNGKPNFMTVAWFTKVNSNPPMMLISLGKKQYTGEGIRENKTFSINIAGNELVKEMDYCGLVSGRVEDKSKLFTVFHGETETAPMIQECPINYELKLLETIELPGTYNYIGEIVAAYTNEKGISEKQPDLPKINPVILIQSPTNHYHQLGQQIAEAFKVGRNLPSQKT